MKKLLGIVVLGLLLSNCSSYTSINGNKSISRFDSTANFVARVKLIPKEDKIDPYIQFYGIGNTKELAIENTINICNNYFESIMSKDQQLRYFQKCEIVYSRITRVYRSVLREEEREEKEKQILLSIIEPKIKKCKAIGFNIGTDGMANCVLKLIEINENEKIAKKAREQEAWKTILLGGIGTSSNSSTNTSSCLKSSETISGLNKICYYNCNGNTKALNIKSTQLCPLNANL